MNTELLLSDEFGEFSKRIAAFQAKKKQLKQELKAYYDKISAQLAEIDEQVGQLLKDFEDGVTTQSVCEDVKNGDE